ncbi:MAG: hemolysin [Blastocatellia bacterium AA13]|nr:MAG: hemolysin [Blastocatellia bacterium AA13]
MEGSSPGWTFLKLALVFFLVLANGFFVASEFALVSVRRANIKALADAGDRNAKVLLRLIENPTVFISAVQLGVTLASLALGYIGEDTMARSVFQPLLSRVISSTIVSYISSQAVAIALAFASITFLHIVLGEITPKTVALEQTQRIALFVARPLYLFYRTFKAAIHLLNSSSVFVLRLFGFKGSLAHMMAYSEEELRQVVSASYQSGVLNENERRLIHNVIEFAEKNVRQIMVPRPQVAALNAASNFNQVVAEFIRSGCSRMPVYRDHLDNIIGVAYIKDMMRLFGRHNRFNLEKHARKPLFIPESAVLEDALRQMQSSKLHFGIVIDEHGSFEGIVTLEDLIEEIVGEIQDEYDESPDSERIRQEPDGASVMPGSIQVVDANRALNLGIPASDDYATVAGFLINQAGRFLAEGDEVDAGDFIYTVVRASRHRVLRVKVSRKSPVAEPSRSAAAE